MAVISKEKIGFMGADFMRVLKCDSKGVFSIDLPPKVGTFMKKNAVTAASRDECIKLFDTALSDYANVKETTQDVILFRVNKKSLRSQDGYARYNHDYRAPNGIGISIEACAYKETRLENSEGTITYSYERISARDSGLPVTAVDGSDLNPPQYGSDKGKQAKNQIPLTPEAVRYFNELEELFARVEQRLLEMTVTPEHFAALLQSGSGVKMLTAK